ncbi:MAG: zinc ribbon domain-containing protein [Acidobacteria bacterium]|nr:zinc ribbon domain-containing protein [Acidobacteriota bacterium]MBI3471795.1 zinc ribbon domain-containing protein [Candidatus Solibacter usitatus]
MFTWICDKCGKECPPTASECPHCAGKGSADTTTAVVEEPKPSGDMAALRGSLAAAERPRRAGLPTWLMSIIFTLGFAGLLGGVFYVVQMKKDQPEAAATPAPAAPQRPAVTEARAVPKSNPMQRHLEISGIRLLQDKSKKTEVHFVVVNHSGAEFSDLSATVSLIARTTKQTDVPVGTFKFKLPLLGPHGSQDLTATLDTTLQVYEIPDWQNLRAEAVFSAP